MKHIYTIFIFLILCVAMPQTYAQPVSLDHSFNSTGSVVTDLNENDEAYAVAVQPDGKILVAGKTVLSANANMVVVRYHANGSLDSSFAGYGKYTIELGSHLDYAAAIKVLPDGSILVACTGYNGYSSTLEYELFKLTASGMHDYTFGDTLFGTPTGIARIDLPVSSEYASDLDIQADGKILVTGTSANAFLVARVHVNGVLDTSYNGAGYVRGHLSGAGSVLTDAFAGLQSDGKLVVAGSYQPISSLPPDMTLMRFNTNGTVDSTFGINGIGQVLFPSGSYCHAMRVQADDKIVVGGRTISVQSMALARLLPDGSLDSLFGTAGKVTRTVGLGLSEVTSVNLQPDGKIVTAGYSTNGSNNDFTLVRYETDGMMDASFGLSGGIVISDFGTDEKAYTGTLQADGKIVVAGTKMTGTELDFITARYNANAVGIDENNAAVNNLGIYPNPANDVVTVQAEKAFVNATITLTDLSGKTIFTQSNVSGSRVEVDLSHYVNGVYILHVSQGAGVSHVKLVKQ